jgi:flagellar motor switch protein FliN/FliY
MSNRNKQRADSAGENNPRPAKPQVLEQDSELRLCDEDANLDMILDIPVTLTVEIGHTRVNIRDLLQLTQGSIVELDRKAGDPLDLKVNGTLIARGEVVVVNERFGIRITDIISPADRVRKLK